MNTESQVLNVPIEDIIPNRFQPRLTFDEEGLKELAASIKEHGIIQPLVLRRLGDKYEIIAGERRYKAAKMANLSFVPAIISALDDKRSAEVAIVENVQRRDLSSIEEAKSYKALLDKGYLTQEELAKRMGLSQSAISNKLRLLSLDNEVQDALMTGKISERHARSLLQIEDKEEQKKWLKKIIDERITVRTLDNMLKELKKETENEEIIELKPINETKKEEVYQNIVDINKSEDIKPIPNKFFNYLENEEINMNTFEPAFEIANDELEEIEFFDFEVATEKEEEKLPDKDMGIANGLIDKVINDIKNSNYTVKLQKDELTSEIKYIITIEKN